MSLALAGPGEMAPASARRRALRLAEHVSSAQMIENNIPEGTRWLLHELRQSGEEAYIIGGALRDLIIGRAPRDYDILTTAPVNVVARRFKGARAVGKRHRIALVPVPGDEGSVEVSSLNSVSNPSSVARLKADVQLGTSEQARLARLQHEAMRRDFTVNALVYDPIRRSVLDFTSGVPDAHARRVRTIGNPHESFLDDPARLLRAVRVTTRLGGYIEKHTKRELRMLAPMVRFCSNGRLHREMCMCFGTGAAEPALKLMWRHGLLDEVLPELASVLSNRGTPRAPRKTPLPGKEDPVHRLLLALDNEHQALMQHNTSMPSEAVLAALALPVCSNHCTTDAFDVCEYLWRNVSRSGWAPPKDVARRAASLLEERGHGLGQLAHGGMNVQSLQHAPLFTT